VSQSESPARHWRDGTNGRPGTPRVTLWLAAEVNPRFDPGMAASQARRQFYEASSGGYVWD
jgi:hypothetical protein